jgi:hypothetical protein
MKILYACCSFQASGLIPEKFSVATLEWGIEFRSGTCSELQRLLDGQIRLPGRPAMCTSELGLRLSLDISLGRIRLTSGISGGASCHSSRTRGNSSKIIISLILCIVLFCQSNAWIWHYIKPRLNLLWYKFRR